MSVTLKEIEGINEGGVCPVMRTIAVTKVTSFPDAIEGVISIAPTVDGTWDEIELVEDTAFPVEDRVDDNGRTYQNFHMVANVAQINHERQAFLERLEREPHLVDITDRNGVRKLIGSKTEGAVIHLRSLSPGKIGHDRNQFDLIIQCARRTRVPFYDPS